MWAIRSFFVDLKCPSWKPCAFAVAADPLSEAGRALFSASRARRTSANDADRLRKYLARFGLG